MTLRRSALAAVITVAAALAGALFLPGALTSRAVQAPVIKIDMVTTGNSYSDPGAGGTNSMTVGTIDPASTGSQNVAHTHSVQLIIQNVEDLVGWQARANYVGDRMRCSTVNVTPFQDTGTGQFLGFANLPIDQVSLVHRSVTPAGGTCPAAAPGPQTHLFGATYNGGMEGPVDAAISPDTPAKPVPDDTSYSAPTGGILATIILSVSAGQCNTGPMLFDLDDGAPNPPGSKVVTFNGTGTTDIFLAESALGDGTHTETGGTCPVGGTATATATATAAATPTRTATATATPAATATRTPTATATATVGATATATRTPTASPSATATATAGAGTGTATATPGGATPTASATGTASPSATATASPSGGTATATATPSGGTPTATPTATATAAATASASPTATPTATAVQGTQTATASPTRTPTATATQAPTGTPTPTPGAATPTRTPAGTPVGGETCDGQPATKVGTDASELIVGTNGPDVIVAKGGNDIILALDGDDIICAGAGRDFVFGGKGNDRIFGQSGNDLLLGGAGDDFLDGGSGFDICVGGPGHDTFVNCERRAVPEDDDDDEGQRDSRSTNDRDDDD